MARRFATTRWSVILAAGGRGDEARDALAELCRIYREPLVSFARHERQGRSTQDAEDLAQGFITDLLARDDLERLDPAKGSFRSWLLQAMRNFIARTAKHNNAQKRGSGDRGVSLDLTRADGSPLHDPSDDVDAERLFHRRWAMTAIRSGMASVRDDVAAGGPEAARLFDRLKDRIAEPGDEGYAELAAELGVQPGALRARVYRWRRLVRAAVAETLRIDGDVDLEIEELIHAL